MAYPFASYLIMSTTGARQGKFEKLLIDFTTRKLENIHPRIKDRSETLWSDALTINLTNSISDALDKLLDNNILCLPVVNNKKEPLGICTLSDIVEWICEKFDSEPEFESVNSFLEKRELLKKTRVSEIYRTRELFTTTANLSIYHAAELMARNDAHRVMLLNHSGQVKGIFTQSMLIGEIYNNLGLLPKSVKKMKVRDMTKSYYVSSVQDDAIALEAFRKMNTWWRSGLAILDKDGKLVDQLSFKDLRGIGKDGKTFLNLYKPVKEFKKHCRAVAKKPLDVKMVTEDGTFEDVIKLLDQGETHRVWVVDSLSTKNPKFTITMTDVIRQIFPNVLNW